jgi:hypothetical protein
VVAGADTTEARGKCTKLFVQIVKKNAKFHLSLEKTVQFIVRIVFQSTKIAADPNGVATLLKSPSGESWRAF